MNPTLSPKLDRDTFLVNQKHRSWMKSKYYVFDEQSAPLFYVERPVKPLQRSNITIYDDDTCANAIFVIEQTHRYAAIRRTYTLSDAASGEPIAHLSRHNLKSWLRRAWEVTDPGGRPIAAAREDSAWIAGFRRVLEWIPYVSIVVSLVRTNFQFFVVGDGGGEERVGAFNRKLSIGDKYILDLRDDAGRRLDRRIALALGIMLDTGEAR
jgi:hypothetical protein